MKDLHLSKGKHPAGRESGMCINEYSAYLAGLEHTDRPECVSPVLQSLMIGLNDNMDDKTRQRLRPYAVRQLGTAGDGQDQERAFIAADWAVRVCAPMALDAVGLDFHADTLRALAPIEGRGTAAAAAVRAARDARDAARATYADARAAADTALATDTALAAAGARAAARAAYVYTAAARAADAVYAAAYTATTTDTTYAAAAAHAVVGVEVWDSALEMLDRIIDPGGIHDVKTEAEWLEGVKA